MLSMKTKEPMKVSDTSVYVRVPDKLKREVERRAKREGRTVSEIVREMLVAYVGKDLPVRAIARRAGT